MKDTRSRLDLAAIAVRSDRDRGVLLQIFPAVRWQSNAPCVSVKSRKSSFTVAVRSRLCGLCVDEDRRSSCRHVASGKPFDRVT